MKHIDKLIHRLKGFTNAILRYPLTSVFLITIAILNGYNINEEINKNITIIMTLAAGACIGVTAQVIFERYFSDEKLKRLMLMGIAALLTAGYYLIIRNLPEQGMQMGIRTVVASFALMIAFIWIPSIKNRITFNETFLISFKAFFIAIFFSGVIFAGVNIIIAAINQLLYQLNYRVNAHSANIIFVLFAPLYFLSLIPVYSGTDKKEGKKSIEEENIVTAEESRDTVEAGRVTVEKGRDEDVLDLVNKMSQYPKFLEILISYIIIPLVSVFTLILLAYIIKNIGKGFWTNNLLEPMIVAYSITVILVYILASRLSNKFAVFYRRIFPKVLVPLVLIQTVSSFLRIQDLGLTHGRYYVILYGIFATAAGILFSFLPVRKNGIIAAMLIGFSLISIIPPVDAFTVSRTSQISMLENLLVKNNMLEDNRLIANASVPKEDQQKIIKYMNYLNSMEYTDSISWLPKGFTFYEDFTTAFGFSPDEYSKGEQQFVYLNLPENIIIDIAGYDYFIPAGIYLNQYGKNEEDSIKEITQDGKKYSLIREYTENQCNIILQDENKNELIRINTKDVFDQFLNYSNVKGLLTLEEATFVQENDQAAVTLIIRNLSIENIPENPYYGADVYLLVKIK